MLKMEGLLEGDDLKIARDEYHKGLLTTNDGRPYLSSSDLKRWKNLTLAKETPSLTRGSEIHRLAERVLLGEDIQVIKQIGRKGSKKYQEQKELLYAGEFLVTETDYRFYHRCLYQIQNFRDSLGEGKVKTEQVCLNPGDVLSLSAFGLEGYGARAMADFLFINKDGAKIVDWKTTSKLGFYDLKKEIEFRGYAYAAWHYYQVFKDFVENLSPVVSLVFLMDKEGAPVEFKVNVKALGFTEKFVKPFLSGVKERKVLFDKFRKGGAFDFGGVL